MQKWYISTLIIILTIIGVVCEQQISIPNQEIVLQFTDSEVSVEEAQITIEIVKKQLQNLGVENIQVTEQETGNIKITYYSDSDVDIIKQSLSREKKLILDYSPIDRSTQDSKFPSDKNTIGYNLDVHEIQKNHDVNRNLNGTPAQELKLKSNHFFNYNVLASFDEAGVSEQESVLKVAYKVNKHIALAIDNASRSIPEVRAGPNAMNLHKA